MSFVLAHQGKNRTADGKSLGSAKVSSYQNNLAKSSHDSVIHLQRTIGNQEVQRLLVRSSAGFDFTKIGIQPKLKVSQPGDEYEQEADRVVEQVMRMSFSDSALPMTTAKEEEEGIDRKCSACEMKEDETERLEKVINRKIIDSSNSNLDVSEIIAQKINNVLLTGGSPLDPSTRAFMESRFGYDFSNVRIHTGGRAAESSDALNASAYTVANNIAFGNGEYIPGTHKGRKLIAHELVHTIQQDPLAASRMHRTTHPNPNYVSDQLEYLPQNTTDAGDGTTPLIQRQQAESGGSDYPEQESQTLSKTWYMLKVPPAVKQPGVTCWAAALSSWLDVMGMNRTSHLDIAFRYEHTTCIACDHSLYVNKADEVYAEWGVKFSSPKRVLRYDTIVSYLKQHGHVLLAEGPGLTAFFHVMVVYGAGIDNTGRPNPDFISVMDPLEGVHKNLNLWSLTYPVWIGFSASRKRPAECLNDKPAQPCEELEPEE